ncbi:response regulator [Flaviaesturariibacter terrae]
MRISIQKLLLVDDDPDDAFLLRKALAELPVAIELSCIEDGDELPAAVARFRPDILFMDMNMPKKNGLECLADLQQMPEYRHLPCVLYSSSEQPDLVAAAYEAGASLFFRKPSTFSDLVAGLEGILSLDWSNPAAIRQRAREASQATER